MNAIDLRAVSASYGGATALREVTVSVPSGSLAAVIGPNGAGKSTLVKAALGLIPATRGQVRLLGEPLQKVRRRVAYVPQQDAVAADFPITAVQVVEMGRYPHRGWFRRLRHADDEAVAAAMEQVGVTDLAGAAIDELSGGQRQRVFLARALAQRADLLILDEPFTAVDARTEASLLDVLASLCAEGATVLAVHHDLRTVRERFDHSVLLAPVRALNGAGTNLVAAGAVADVLAQENLEQAYGLAPLSHQAAGAAGGA